MKTNLFVLFLCVLFIQCKDSQKTNILEIEKENIPMETKQLVGGFSAMEVTPFISELAAYVLNENNITSPIKEITNLSSQVVSGKNYKFDMLLEDGKKYTTKVYVNLKGAKEISDFKLIP